ncbi:MAG: hypothetical protein OXD31_05190 [Chloroflexi bacterium]|nr:hypothetical protein [Chloroflexota bacterium]
MDYVQDPSSSHFNEAPIPNLVREVIQNSLDARYDGLSEPVRVTFSEFSVKKALIGGSALERHVRGCRDRAEEKNWPDIAESYQRALDVLSQSEIRCLKIEDSGTTGLKDNLWNSLVTQEGAVNKVGQIAGGAYGIGKNAVLNVSDLNTVFYSTRFIGRDGPKKRRIRGRIDKLQGKATLMSHPDPSASDEMLQHIGFYTDEDGGPLTGARVIPRDFRLDDTGTGVFIMGFNPRSDDWTAEVAKAAADNYFYAIHHKQLVVSIRPLDGVPIEIVHDTLDNQFTDRNAPAYFYYRAVREAKPRRTKQIDNLGELDTYLLFDENAPRRTGYINRNGMLITDSREQADNPLAPRGKGFWPNYAAMVMPGTDEGDMWVRQMENPSHTTISPDQLPDRTEIRAAKNCFLEARRALTKIIDEESGLAVFGHTSNIGELARFLPEEGEGTDQDEVLKVRNIERRRPAVRLGDPQGWEDEGDDGDDYESSGRGNEGDKSDASDKSTAEGKGDIGNQPRAARYALNNVRVIPRSSTECYIAFTPETEDDLEISLPLIPAGADMHPGKDPNRRRKVEVVDVEAVNNTDADIYIKNGEVRVRPKSVSRVVIRVETDSSLDGYAFTLTR